MIFATLDQGFARRTSSKNKIALHVSLTRMSQMRSKTSNGHLSVQYFEINYFNIKSSFPSTTKLVAFKGHTSTD